MAIKFHPEPGTIVICDFQGMKAPEMIKRRPVIVLSPRLRFRGGLCTVVPLSTTSPPTVQPYHYRLATNPPLPEPYNADFHWVKGDMVYTVSFDRLSLPFAGKNSDGTRAYDVRVIGAVDMLSVQLAVIAGLGLGRILTKDD